MSYDDHDPRPEGPGPSEDESTHRISVLVVDDHEVLSGSLALAVDAEPDMATVGVARDLAGARAGVAHHSPDVILLDRRLPDGDGVEAIGGLRALHPDVKVVVLTASDNDHVLVQAIEAGASGFLSKTRGLGEVISAVRSAAAGEAVISGEMLSRLLPKLTRQAGPTVELTPREQDVLELLAQGMSNAAIAETLFVSVHTVRNHVANLSTKLGAHSKLEALAIAVRRGLLRTGTDRAPSGGRLNPGTSGHARPSGQLWPSTCARDRPLHPSRKELVMGALSQLVSRVAGGRGSRRGTTPAAGSTGPTGGGGRTQDEAIGRGVRRLLGRFRR